MVARLHIAVVGAGMSGIAAALACQAAGANVTLFEAAPQAGGRTRSVVLHETTLDNGQHLALGAYHHTLTLLKAAKIAEQAVFKRLPLALHMHGGAQQVHITPSPFLPAPLHLLLGIVGAQGLSLRDKWQALRWMLRCKLQRFQCAAGLTVAQLLTHAQQTQHAITWLWEPLCLAALNTPMDKASAQTFLRVLEKSFAHRHRDSDFLVMRADLGHALIQPLLDYFLAQGGQLQLQTQVKALNSLAHACTLNTQRGDWQVDGVVVAVGPHQRQALSFSERLPATPRASVASTEITAEMAYHPISTVYLQYGQPLRLPYPIMGLCQGLAQWVFDRGVCCDQPGLLAVVISAHAANVDKSNWVAQISSELSKALAPYGISLPEQPLWSKVITEKRATFSCTPAYQSIKNRNTRQHPRIQIAGDDLISDYPATIESAVMSGQQAAHALVNDLIAAK